MGAQKMTEPRHDDRGKLLLVLAASFVLAFIGALLAEGICRLIA